MSENLAKLNARLADINALNAANAIMDWDHQCYMPKGGARARGEHQASLSRMAHELFVADETKTLLDKAKAETSGDEDTEAMLRVVSRDLEISTKLPSSLVAEKSKLSAQGHEDWVEARSTDDFSKFAPILEKLIELAQKEAECLGYSDHIYDALTDQYEEGASKKYWDGMFDTIRQPLVDLVAKIKEKPAPDDSFLTGDFPASAQSDFSHKLVRAIGFDLDRGRIDVAAHPFCTGWSIGDIRLTTRYQNFLNTSIFGTLHEAGHGMYEQGTPKKWDLTPLAGGVSLGVHESQSRTWENLVGRSRPFWDHFYGELQVTFPAFQSISQDAYYRAINRVEPSLIRVEADEVTYNLHIMIRFELECALLEGSVKVKDLPEAWNEKYRAYLGIVPPSDANGCLQDVHWSAALMGYFPTYSMGNILSYQFWEKLEADLGDVNAMMAKGDFAPILGWLQTKIYSQGKKYKPQDLVKRVCGEPLNAEPYNRRISAKYSELYGL